MYIHDCEGTSISILWLAEPTNNSIVQRKKYQNWSARSTPHRDAERMHVEIATPWVGPSYHTFQNILRMHAASKSNLLCENGPSSEKARYFYDRNHLSPLL